MSNDDLLSLEDKRLLNRTIAARELIINVHTQDGKLPTTEEDQNFLIRALDGLDRTILSKAKLKSDDNNAKTQQQTTNMIAQLLLNVSAKATDKPRTVTPVLDNSVKLENVVPGETDIGTINLSYGEIVNNKD